MILLNRITIVAGGRNHGDEIETPCWLNVDEIRFVEPLNDCRCKVEMQVPRDGEATCVWEVTHSADGVVEAIRMARVDRVSLGL